MIKGELLRKAIHILIALVPFLASCDLSGTALLLMAGILFYTCAESMRFLGFFPPVISSITAIVLRRREQGRFALAPVTLGIGAFLTIILFPPQIAAACVYILAFGDSAGTIIGKFIGRFRPAFLAGKSIEGSIACLLVSFTAVYIIFNDWKVSLAAGFAALITDILPLGDFDNIVMPLFSGLSISLFFILQA